MNKVTVITKKTEVITLKTGSRGPQGVKGDKGNQWRGAYSGATAYVVDDVVSYLGSSYICILASTNNLPTNITFWSLFATTGTANASNVTNTPAGNISATNVQNAINELDTEKANTVHTHPISDVTNLQTALNGKVDKLMATNLITNGDFSNGTTGWISNGASFTVVGGVARFTASGTFGRITNANSISVVAGRRYYLFADLKTNAVAGIIGIAFVNFTTGNIRNILSASQQRISGIQTATASGAPLCGIIDYRSSGFDEIEVYRFGGIDLTTTFGAGNEPTREQMDYLLSNFPNSWFNGTVELMNYRQLLDYAIDLDNAKANRVQEAWITPTLLNGWTQVTGHEAAYMRDTLGFVRFKGAVTTGALSTVIFNLPAGYRPAQPRSFPVVANGLFGRINVTTAGAVVLATGTASIVYLDGITYRGEI